jgi:hypothetical protein
MKAELPFLSAHFPFQTPIKAGSKTIWEKLEWLVLKFLEAPAAGLPSPTTATGAQAIVASRNHKFEVVPPEVKSVLHRFKPLVADRDILGRLGLAARHGLDVERCHPRKCLLSPECRVSADLDLTFIRHRAS